MCENKKFEQCCFVKAPLLRSIFLVMMILEVNLARFSLRGNGAEFPFLSSTLLFKARQPGLLLSACIEYFLFSRDLDLGSIFSFPFARTNRKTNIQQSFCSNAVYDGRRKTNVQKRKQTHFPFLIQGDNFDVFPFSTLFVIRVGIKLTFVKVFEIVSFIFAELNFV